MLGVGFCGWNDDYFSLKYIEGEKNMNELKEKMELRIKISKAILGKE